MIPEERTLVENVETHLTQLQGRMCSMPSDEALLRVIQLMDGTAANIREIFNARRPLLSIPTELLQIIMAFIPDAVKSDMLRPVWDAEMYDTAMIIPISQTCRRLRQVALGCPALWTSITEGPPSRARLFAQRSRGMPLELFLPVGRISEYVPADVAKDLRNRLRVLHVRDSAGRITRDALQDILTEGLLPHLESLSVQFYEHPDPSEEESEQWGYFHDVPDYTYPEYVPRLRRVCLELCYLDTPGFLFPVTHLAIKNVDYFYAQSKIQRILAFCDTLESLHLEDVRDYPDPLQPDPPFAFDCQTPRTLHACRRLRRVALLKMNGHLASYILSQVLADQDGLALQLHHLRTPLDPVLPRDLLAGTSLLNIGRYPYRSSTDVDYSFLWGMTASGPRRTYRATTATLLDTVAPLLRGGPQALGTVRELWLTDVPPSTGRQKDLLATESALLLKKTIAAMPALDTFVLANQMQIDWMCARPSLALLPDMRDAVSWPPITTLRIVYGYRPEVRNVQNQNAWPWPKLVPVPVPVLILAGILCELASGAYDYLEHLVLEIPHRVSVNQGELARLREHFVTAEVKVMDDMPEMDLPAYCVEPGAWPKSVKSEPWPSTLW
ncbi:uncharacterized protein TRAVEDRAFT_42643 [Trametes versicolor FP-101664 SS1]|uniref:uncharacterized protein n=1 Tax=Trametes versicolor (strain FP-101664) TaxID=717944 RepID=UPI0004621D8D|nr:uncharacterized protein TRAVEDRAFT_42643 [Trametes versicolor FP-101664 SS1]EIW65265.1 hypothetical protein TRAVEDRAFT_42643 [Trametes versicolor FP-101664 SS1]